VSAALSLHQSPELRNIYLRAIGPAYFPIPAGLDIFWMLLEVVCESISVTDYTRTIHRRF
jgi:hypothetical protein